MAISTPADRSLSTKCPFALGTADWPSVPDAGVEELYSAFRTRGGRIFDTAHCYAFWLGALGKPERQLGSLVRRLERSREDVFIVTKGGHVAVPPDYPRPDRYLAPEVVERDVNESLERLSCGHIDLYLLHRDDPRVPASEHLAALQPFLRRGDIRAIGVSNWIPARVDEANDFANRKGYTPFTVNQVRYNLAHLTDPDAGDPTIAHVTPADVEWYARTGFTMMAFSATANGYFSGRNPASYVNAVSEARRRTATELAKAHRSTSTQIAVAWLLAHPFPVWPTFFTRSQEHLAEIMGSVDVSVAPQELERLAQVSVVETPPT